MHSKTNRLGATRNKTSRALWRILLNIVVKILYVAANVIGLLIMDSALNGAFLSYGASWMRWTGN